MGGSSIFTMINQEQDILSVNGIHFEREMPKQGCLEDLMAGSES
jgi:hypothetical protein